MLTTFNYEHKGILSQKKKRVTRRLALDFEPLLLKFNTLIYYLLMINYNKSHNALDYN